MLVWEHASMLAGGVVSMLEGEHDGTFPSLSGTHDGAEKP
jgi:hypothetical protein